VAEEVHIGEAARRLGVSTALLRRLEREGKIPPARRDFNDRIYNHPELAGADVVETCVSDSWEAV
jgi:DNA-binding transcriptional MerR regulator